MNRLIKSFLLILIAGQAGQTPLTRVQAQGTFQNLDFESATVSPGDPPSTVPVSIGMPGWTVFIGTTPQSTILFNDSTLGTSSLAILGRGNSLSPVIEGNFTALLFAGADPANNQLPADVSLSQTGRLPANANAILFKARGGLAGFTVAVGGQAIPIVSVLATADYTLYGGDVSSFAGQSAILKITALSDVPRGPNVFALDSISFSPQQVPEPSAGVLVVCGLAAVGLHRWCSIRWT
jgi:hypothetical protein